MSKYFVCLSLLVLCATASAEDKIICIDKEKLSKEDIRKLISYLMSTNNEKVFISSLAEKGLIVINPETPFNLPPEPNFSRD